MSSLVMFERNGPLLLEACEQAEISNSQGCSKGMCWIKEEVLAMFVRNVR